MHLYLYIFERPLWGGGGQAHYFPTMYSSSLKFSTACGWNTVNAVIIMPVVKASVSMMMGAAIR